MKAVLVSVVLLLYCLTAGVSGSEPEDICSETRVCATPEVCFMAKNDSCSIYEANKTCVLDAYFRRVNSTCQNVTIRLRNRWTYNLSNAFNFTNHQYFELTGCDGEECVPGASIKCTGQEGGLFFEGIHGAVKMKGVHFVDCQFSVQRFASPHPATGRVGDQAALYVGASSAVSLDYVNVTRTKGVGLICNSVIQAHITNSVFRDSEHGVQVFMPQNTDASKPPTPISRGDSKAPQYSFNSCRFINNSALPTSRIHNSSTEWRTFQSHRGGGLALFWMGNASYVVVSISNCMFCENKAVYGGGLLAYLQGIATNNTLHISYTTFVGNEGAHYNRKTKRIESGGGGAQVMLAAYPYDQPRCMSHNRITFQHCTFTNNTAYWGGGLSIVSAHEESKSGDNATNYFLLENCSWRFNRARLGSAVDGIMWNEHGSGALPVVTVANNTIASNTIIYNEEDRFTIGGVGTIYTDLIPLNLKGNNTFSCNTGSGITAVNAVVSFKMDSYTRFFKNHGLYGGGLSLYGTAKMVLYSGTHIVFDTNSAKLEGGAIFYHIGGPRNLITTQNCFIQYENATTHPKEWNVTIKFHCNYAEMNGLSVLASSLLPCIWTGAPFGHGWEVDANTALKQVLHWNNDTFVFSENNSCNSSGDAANHRPGIEISTGPAEASDSLFNITDYPGHTLQLSEFVGDELNSPLSTVFRGVSSNHTKGDLQEGGQYVSNMTMQFQGSVGASFNFTLYGPWALVFIVQSNVTLLQCPPGFNYDGHKRRCICAEKGTWAITGCSYPETGCSYPDCPCCKPSKECAMLRSGYWAGYINNNTSDSEQYGKLCTDEEITNITNSNCIFVSGSCHKGSCSKLYTGTLDDSKALPARANTTEITQIVCSPQNTRGILCSKCKDGYGYNILGYDLECVQCNKNASAQDYARVWMQWIAARFLPMVIMVSVFLLFDIDILTGSMQTFIFYSQMITFLSPLLDKAIDIRTTVAPAEVSFMMYDIWQLKYFEYILVSAPNNIGSSPCFRGYRLTIISLEYLLAVFPFIFIYTTWLLKCLQDRGYICCCWPCKSLVQKASVAIHRLRRKWSPNSTIIHGLSAFMVLSYTKFLITSMKLLMPSYLYEYTKIKFYKVHFDSNLQYASNEHLPYMIGAILVLLTFVAIPPLILILVPLVPRAAVHFQPERSNRIIWLCDKMFSGPKWQFFLDAFQGGFKPRYSFFAGLLFLYRIGIVATYSFSSRLEFQYLFQLLLVVIFLIIHSMFQPYKRKIHNVIDTLIYGNMLIVLITGLGIWYQSSHVKILEKPIIHFSIIMMNIPQISFFVYLIYKTVKGVRKGVVVWRLRRRANGAPLGETSSEERDRELLTDSFHYRIDYAALDEELASEMAFTD